MDYLQAMELARQGKKVRRPSWAREITIAADEHGIYCEYTGEKSKWSYEPTVEEESATDWELLGQMNFLEACKLLKAGRRVRRASWVNMPFQPSFWVELRDSELYIGSRETQVWPLSPKVDTILATDWEEHSDSVL
jgi:hypothetical protein